MAANQILVALRVSVGTLPLYLARKRPVWRTGFFYEHATFRGVDFIPAPEALVLRNAK